MEKYNKAVMEINEMEAVDVLTASFGGSGEDGTGVAACSCGSVFHDPTKNTVIVVGDSTSTGKAYSDYCDLDCAGHVH
jgi:hypothetical protein